MEREKKEKNELEEVKKKNMNRRGMRKGKTKDEKERHMKV